MEIWKRILNTCACTAEEDLEAKVVGRGGLGNKSDKAAVCCEDAEENEDRNS